MEKEQYIRELNARASVSSALGTYLRLTLQEEKHAKNEHVPLGGKANRGLPYLFKGCARLYCKTGELQKDSTLLFFYTGDFLTFLPYLDRHPGFPLYLEFLEESLVVDFDHRHYKNLLKIFREFSIQVSKLEEEFLEHVFSQLADRNSLSGRAHYDKLISRHPELLNCCPLKDIASFLGLEAKSLGQLRAKGQKKP